MKLNFNRVLPNGIEVTSSPIVALVSVIFLSFPLLLWKISFSESNWAILILTPTALLLFLAFRDVLMPIFEDRVKVELRPKYTKSAFLIAKCKANIFSIFFAIVMLPILALLATSNLVLVLLSLLALCFATNLLTLLLLPIVQKYYTEPYADWNVLIVSSIASTVLFLPILAGLYLNHLSTLSSCSGFSDLVDGISAFGLGRIEADLGSLIRALEVIDCMFARLFNGLGGFIMLLYSIYLAAIAFVVAEASALVTNYTKRLITTYYEMRQSRLD